MRHEIELCRCGHTYDEHELGAGACASDGCECRRFRETPREDHEG